MRQELGGGRGAGAGESRAEAEVQPCTSALTQRLLDLRGWAVPPRNGRRSVGARRAGAVPRETAGWEDRMCSRSFLLHAPSSRVTPLGALNSRSSLVWCSASHPGLSLQPR